MGAEYWWNSLETYMYLILAVYWTNTIQELLSLGQSPQFASFSFNQVIYFDLLTVISGAVIVWALFFSCRDSINFLYDIRKRKSLVLHENTKSLMLHEIFEKFYLAWENHKVSSCMRKLKSLILHEISSNMIFFFKS